MNDKHGQDTGCNERELREELSAYMDGELDADRARFLLQRLRHDAELRECWERWQLQSAALRRQAQPLPSGFPARVAAAILAQPVSATPSRQHRLLWVGGVALAASLAVAGVFVFEVLQKPHSVAPFVAASRAATRTTPVANAMAATQPPAQHSAPSPAPTAASLSVPTERIAAAKPPTNATTATHAREQGRIHAPIRVTDDAVVAFRSPSRPLLFHRDRPRPQFSPFPQPFLVDPDLAAYLQQQKSGDSLDIFRRRELNPADSNAAAVRSVSYPQDDRH